MASGYANLKNELVSAANGVGYAYRDTGGGSDGTVPLVLLLADATVKMSPPRPLLQGGDWPAACMPWRAVLR